MPLTDDQLDRYARHLVLPEIGGPGQQALLKARVLVIGAGGLGSPLIAYLAAAGVGTLGIVDDDTVALSNLQRQILHGTDQLGVPKTHSAVAAVARLNPDVTVEAHSLRLTADSADALIKDYDIVADGCDNFTTRLIVSDACVRHRKTLVSAAVRRFEGQLAVFKPHAGQTLPCYRCYVPEAPPQDGDSCAEQGILGVIPGILGTLQAQEVIREITGFGDSTAGRLLIYDGLTASSRWIGLARDPACAACGAGR